jgi:hypothetical protein
MNRICDRDPTFYSFDVPRYFRSAVQNLIKYLEEDIIPAAPGQVEPGSPEALQYTELILSLCCFAEFLEIDDLANRSMDALRCHEYQCGGSLLGQHLQDLYANTKKGSKLRHFIAVSAAYFLCNAQDTVEHRAARAAISRFFESIPQFEHDILEAQSVFSEKLEVRDEDPFPACEFHTHLPGDICHASVAEDCILYIGRLSYPTTEEDLTTFFNGMGYVV